MKDSDSRAAIESADIIYGHDVATNQRAVLFGVTALRRVVDLTRMKTITIAYDSRLPSGMGDVMELEYVLAAIRHVKGYDDYDVPAESDNRPVERGQHRIGFQFKTKGRKR